MNDFVIYTDSACDISPERLARWGVCYSSLSFRFDGVEHDYLDHGMTATDFYAKMRAGGIAKTSALNAETFAAGLSPFCKQGGIFCISAFLRDSVRPFTQAAVPQASWRKNTPIAAL